MSGVALKAVYSLAQQLKDEQGRQRLLIIVFSVIGAFCLLVILPGAVFSVLLNGDTAYYNPCPEYSTITDHFGERVDPLTGEKGTQHSGLDLAADNGTDVVAAMSGTVTAINTTCTHNFGKTESCGCGQGYGNYIKIKHQNGTSTVYAHLSSVEVQVGDFVDTAEKIGSVGSTGKSTGFHLHFEIIENGKKIDPEPFIFDEESDVTNEQ